MNEVIHLSPQNCTQVEGQNCTFTCEATEPDIEPIFPIIETLKEKMTKMLPNDQNLTNYQLIITVRPPLNGTYIVCWAKNSSTNETKSAQIFVKSQGIYTMQ